MLKSAKNGYFYDRRHSKKGVLFMFGGSRVLKLVPEVVINMGGNKKLVIGSIHESRCQSDTLVPPLL